MAFRRRQLPVKLTDGEVFCPRKTVAVPAIIAVSTCKAMHESAPRLCSNCSCNTFIKANDEVRLLRKHSMGAELMFPETGGQGGRSDGEDTSADAV